MATSTVQQMFVGGSWQPSASGETFEASSPATGELIASIPQGDRSDAVRAIDAARGAAEGGLGSPRSSARRRCMPSAT